MLTLINLICEATEDNVWTRLNNPYMIAGIILAAIGLAFTLLAKRITRVVRKKEEIEETDKVYLSIKALALVMILVALIVIMFANK